MTAPAAPAPGFYADPLDPGGQRWWDGSAWTETVRALDTDPDAYTDPDAVGVGVVVSDDGGPDDPFDSDEPIVSDEPDEDDPDFVPRLAPDPLRAAVRAV